VSHLGLWLSALVDGELDGMERDRVLNHVAGCDACRREANAMRALKRRLTALGETCAETAIAGRLIELASSDEDSTGSRPHGWGAWGPADDFGPFTRRRARLNLTGLKVATGSAGSALIAVAVLSFLLGSGSNGPPAPKITPSVDSYMLQHSRDAGQEPAGAGTVSGHPAYRRYKAGPTSPYELVRLDPARGPERISPFVPPAGTGSPGPVVSMSASPGPVASTTGGQRPAASATASPTATSSGQSGRSTGTKPARYNSK
jgi:Putative zinc-finger